MARTGSRPVGAVAWVAQGFDHFEAERYREAARSFRIAVALAPRLAEAHRGLGHALIQMNRSDAALAAFEQACRLDRRDADSRWVLGVLYDAAGRHAAAIRAFRRATDLKPTEAELFVSLGLEYDTVEKWEKGIEAYRRALELDPKNCDVLLQIGMSYVLTGNERAIRRTLRALDRLAPAKAAMLREASSETGDEAAACRPRRKAKR